MWKLKLQKIVGNLLARLDELRKLYMKGMVIQKFLAKWKKILRKICFSEQIFYRKQLLDALDQNCEKQQ